MGKHDGSEGRKSVKIATKNSLIVQASETAHPPRSNSRNYGKASKFPPKTPNVICVKDAIEKDDTA